MKPFNLKEYLANPSMKVVTRIGKKVRIICTDMENSNYPIIALVKNGIREEPLCYTKDGEFRLNNPHDCDLFFSPEKYEGWVNLLKDLNGDNFVGSPIIYETKEKAEKDGKESNNYVSTAKIEWEE